MLAEGKFCGGQRLMRHERKHGKEGSHKEGSSKVPHQEFSSILLLSSVICNCELLMSLLSTGNLQNTSLAGTNHSESIFRITQPICLTRSLKKWKDILLHVPFQEYDMV